MAYTFRRGTCETPSGGRDSSWAPQGKEEALTAAAGYLPGGSREEGSRLLRIFPSKAKDKQKQGTTNREISLRYQKLFFFPTRVVKHWNRLSGEVAEFALLEMLQIVWSKLIWPQVWPWYDQGVTAVSLVRVSVWIMLWFLCLKYFFEANIFLEDLSDPELM